MSEKSREEKLASAKKKLKKFQENNTKDKNKGNNDFEHSITNNQVSNSHNDSNLLQIESIEYQTNDPEIPISINRRDIDVSRIDFEEPTITTESLKHISRHINGIISCSSSSIDRETQLEYINTIHDLEKRNIELANFNSQKAEQIEMLQVKINNLNETTTRFSKDRTNELLNLENSYKRQLEVNKDQFQAQIHTISLLVAEKSELQSQVTHNQKVAAQRHQENEDITNKLKNSRQKVGDLEKVLIEMKTKNEKLEEAYRDISRQTEQLRNTIKRIKSEKEDSSSECLQLRSKLVSKTQEVANLELTLDDVKSQLEMSQVQIQHLTNSQEGHYDNMYSQLKLTEQKNLELLQNLESSKLQLQQLECQNVRIQNQYRTYFEQMEEKIKTLQSELSYTKEERNEVTLKLENIKINRSETEDNKNIDVSYLQNYISKLQQERDLLLEKNENFDTLVKGLNKTVDSLSNDNGHLTKAIEDLEEKNLDLMERNNQFQMNKVDHIDLLQQLQSDKTALSRALAQNKQLKSQLIELQEAFVKLSSDNMDVSTKLDHEKHISKELSSRLGEQEEDLNEIRLIVGSKDDEIARLIQSNKLITEELLTTNNSSENNYPQRSESHFNMANKELIAMLQMDVYHLQEKINQLTTENNSLRCLKEQSDDGDILRSSTSNKSNEYNSDNISILQLEAERNELLSKCEAYNAKETQLTYLLESYKAATDEQNSIITKEKYQSLQLSMTQINEKLNKIMEKNMHILEDNKRLEHVVAQLEGETDTIGEYISLYQHQRSMLKQRSLAKDQFMSKLMHQKQLLDSRLLTLENLIRRLNLSDVITISDSATRDSVITDHTDSRSKMSTFNQILNIIQELQKPSDYTIQTLPRTSDDIEIKSNPDDPITSDYVNLFHSEFIHCKCCVGKVIDL